MASIRKRGSSQYQIRICLNGYSVVYRTFKTRQAAFLWGSQREQLVASGASEAQ